MLVLVCECKVVWVSVDATCHIEELVLRASVAGCCAGRSQLSLVLGDGAKVRADD